MLKRNTKVAMPTDDEDRQIQAGIAEDNDNPEWTAAAFSKAKPAAEFFDTATMAGLQSLKRKRGERGPQRTATKTSITVRVPTEPLEEFRKSGDGWQTRLGEAIDSVVHSPRTVYRERGSRKLTWRSYKLASYAATGTIESGTSNEPAAIVVLAGWFTAGKSGEPVFVQLDGSPLTAEQAYKLAES